MSGYQVQTPPRFNTFNVVSPFSPTDTLQNEQIYNLQSANQYVEGCNEFNSVVNPELLAQRSYPAGFSSAGAGYVIVPESATNYLTPLQLPDEVVGNRYVRLGLGVSGNAPGTPNTGAYSIGGGPATGAFQPSQVQTYYVKTSVGGYDPDNGYITFPAQRTFEFYNKIKGQYGLNQLPIGYRIFHPIIQIPRGKAIVVGAPVPVGSSLDVTGDTGDGYGTDYWAAYVNPLDFAGAPLVFDCSAVVANTNLNSTDIGYISARWTNPEGILEPIVYTYYGDLDFATLAPELYNVPASLCPKLNYVAPGLPQQQTWPQPL